MQIDIPDCFAKAKDIIPAEFVIELTALINKFSLENLSDTPDHILAQVAAEAISHYSANVNKREAWYGRITEESLKQKK